MYNIKDVLESSHFRALGAVLLVSAALLRVAAFSGYVGGDDWHYLTSAVELSTGQLTPGGGHWQYRSGVTVPAALLYKAGAPVWLVLSGMTFVWSLLCVIIAYWAGIEFTRDRRTALLSAGLLAVFPLDIIYATCLYPVLGLAGTTALAGIFFSRALRRCSRLDFLALGACLGLGYLYRVTALYIGIPMLIWAIWKKQWHWGYLLTAVSALLFVGFEMGLYAFVEDDPLTRWKVLTARTETQTTAPAKSYEDSAIRPGGPLFSPVVSLVTNQEFGLFYVALPFALVGLYRAKRKWQAHDVPQAWPPQFVFLVLWLLTVLVYTMWGSTNPFDYKPLRPWPRYFSHVTIPLCTVLAFWLVRCWHAKARYAIVAVLAAVSLLGVALDSSRTFRTVGPDLLQVRQEYPDVSFRVVRHAYMFMWVANNGTPSGVDVISLHPDGNDERAELMRKISPEVELIGPWATVNEGVVIINASDVKEAPAHWKKVREIRREKTFAANIGSKMGGAIGKLLNRSGSKHEFAVFLVNDANQGD